MGEMRKRLEWRVGVVRFEAAGPMIWHGMALVSVYLRYHPSLRLLLTSVLYFVFCVGRRGKHRGAIRAKM